MQWWMKPSLISWLGFQLVCKTPYLSGAALIYIYWKSSLRLSSGSQVRYVSVLPRVIIPLTRLCCLDLVPSKTHVLLVYASWPTWLQSLTADILDRHLLMAAWCFFWGALSILSWAIIGRTIPKVLGYPANLIPLCCWLQPFPHALITSAVPRAGLWAHFPLLALKQLSATDWKLLELQCRGCWLMPVSLPTSLHHSHSNIASLLSRKETWAEGNTEDPCGSVCQSPVCIKFANNSPHEDSRAFSLLWGLVCRLIWENWPLFPPPVWCPLSFGDFSGMLHGVRGYSLPICWICWNVSGRTAELVFFARTVMLCVAGVQPKGMARYCMLMSRHEPGQKDLAAERTLQSIKKGTRGNITQEPSTILLLLRSPVLSSLS